MGVEDQGNSPGIRLCYLSDTEPDRCLGQLVHNARAAALSLTTNLISAHECVCVWFIIVLLIFAGWIEMANQTISGVFIGVIL